MTDRSSAIAGSARAGDAQVKAIVQEAGIEAK